MIKRYMIICLTLSFVSICCGQMRKNDYRLDSELFRRGLIERGFDDWVKLYDEQHPPMSDIDLLAEQIANAWLKYRRASNNQIRKQALKELLTLESDRVESYPEHPLSPIWHIRLAADLLNEKYGAYAFISLVNLSLPDNYHKEFLTGLNTIESHLDDAEKILQIRLNKFKQLNNAKLEQINRQGLTELYLSSQIQAESLRAWCLFHHLKLLKREDSEYVKLLYKLDNLLKKLNKEIASGHTSSLSLIQISTERLLGNYSQAENLLEHTRKTVSASYKIFIAIEGALLALEQNKPIIAELQIKQGYNDAKFYQNEKGKYELIMLALAMLDSRAKLAQLPAELRCNKQARNKIWKNLIAILQVNPQFGELIFDKIVNSNNGANIERCPLSGQADIEIYARVQNAIRNEKFPLAESMLKQLIHRENVSSFLKQQAAILLANIFEKQGKFVKAAKIIESSIDAKNNNNKPNCKLLAESARLSWLAMRAKPKNNICKEAFIKAARRLILACPENPYSDRFKLLIADELCEEKKFNEAIQWIEQISPGSEFYLQSRAERVLILTREFKDSITRAGQSNFIRNLANQIESACTDMLTIAAANQAQPDNPKQWKLDKAQIQIIGAAILATVNILTNENIARTEQANYLLSKYKPILEKYEKSSSSAVISQINTLLKQNKADSIKQAIALARKLLTQKANDKSHSKQNTSVIIAILETAHQYMLTHYANPITNSNPLAKLSLDLAKQYRNKLLNNNIISSTQYNKFITIYAILASDSGQYQLADKLLKTVSTIPREYIIDVKLAKARIDFANQNYMSATRKTMEILQQVLPSDIRYWQSLILNLSSHLKIGSDPAQIVNAILARAAEHPQMGTTATKKQLTKILQAAQARIKITTKAQQK